MCFIVRCEGYANYFAALDENNTREVAAKVDTYECDVDEDLEHSIIKKKKINAMRNALGLRQRLYRGFKCYQC
jgi:hypothetical protein